MRNLLSLGLLTLLLGCAAPGTFDNTPADFSDPQTIEDSLALLETLAGVQVGEDISADDLKKIKRVCAGLRLRAIAGYDYGTTPWRMWCDSLLD